MSTDRVYLVYKARLAEQAERYDEMSSFMKLVAMSGEPLATDERNLLSVAYKNSVGERRSAWRIISSIEAKQQAKGEEELANLAGKYREKIESELQKICHEILDLLTDHLLSNSSELTEECQVFYYKMEGDYFRYIAEFSPADAREAPKKSAEEAYKKGSEASLALSEVNPIRLGLALNFSVFYYEIMNETAKAVAMARKTFDEALQALDSKSDSEYQDAALIVQLIRDNLTLWSQEAGKDETAEKGETQQ